MTCPLSNLPAVADETCMEELDRFKTTGRIYFKKNDTLDYFASSSTKVSMSPPQMSR